MKKNTKQYGTLAPASKTKMKKVKAAPTGRGKSHGFVYEQIKHEDTKTKTRGSCPNP